jgi:hypothetical protein
VNWQQLKQYLEQSYDFFGRIGVSGSSDQQSVAIHPVLKFSASLALKTMYATDKNRLVILLPNRLDCARWIATLCTLQVMKEDYHGSSGDIKFSPGQRLLVNRCIVEFLREEFSSEYNRWYMWVECGDGARYRISLDRALAFQPVSTSRPLSALEAVVKAVNSADRLDSPVDGILRIQTMGNKALFKANVILVSRIGETEHFIRETQINRSSLIDLFLWGKLDGEGNIFIAGPQQIQGNPCCIVSADLFGVWNYVHDTLNKSKGIILDGSGSYINSLQVLDDILDERIPVIAVCDLLDTEHLQHLADRGFIIWQWNRKNIVQSGAINEAHKISPFSCLNDSIFNYCDQKIEVALCHHPQLDTVVEASIKLRKLVSLDEQMDILLGRLIQLVNNFSRLIRIPERSWSEHLQQKLSLLRQQFNSHQQWLPDKAVQHIDAIFGGLMDLAERPFASNNHKPNRLGDLINEISESEMTGVLVAGTEETELSRRYWEARLPGEKLRNIHFVTLPELVSPDRSFVPDQVITCGWLNGEKMFCLLHSNIAPCITMLMYPFEAKWFRAAQQVWTRQNSYNIRARDFTDMLGLTEKDLEAIEYKSEEPVEAAKKDAFDIFEFELKIRQNRYRSYVFSGDTREEVSRAKLVVFAGNRFAYLTESHRLPVVTEVMKEKGSVEGFPRKDVTQLQASDYVLFQESNRDIIREIADRGLVKAGQPHLRQVAGLWREALREKYQKISGGLDGLVELLRNAGCRRHPATIKNWLFDEDQIGPGIITDLQHIAKATGNRSLSEGLDEVSGAILRVRGAHHEASIYIRNKLLANLPEIMMSERSLPNYVSGAMLLNLDEFGQVEILQIEEIGDDWEEIPASSVNRLHSEED